MFISFFVFPDISKDDRFYCVRPRRWAFSFTKVDERVSRERMPIQPEKSLFFYLSTGSGGWHHQSVDRAN